MELEKQLHNKTLELDQAREKAQKEITSLEFHMKQKKEERLKEQEQRLFQKHDDEKQ